MGDEKTKERLLPTDEARKCATAMRGLICGLTLSEALIEILFKKCPGKRGSRENCFQTSLELIVSLVSCIASAVSGYACYSPMDPGEEQETKVTDSDFQAAAEMSKWYTRIWWLKTVMFGVRGTVSIVESCNKEACSPNIRRNIDILSCALHFVGCSLEITGAVKAASFKADNQVFADEEEDKKIYLCDTSSYIIDDFQGILDDVVGICSAMHIKVSNIDLIHSTAHGILAIGSCTALAISADELRN